MPLPFLAAVATAGLVCGATSSTSAALIVAWDFTGAGNEATVNATTQNLLGAPVVLSRGPGLNATSLAGGYFNSSGFTTGGGNSLANAPTNGDYLLFGLVVPTGSTLSLSAIDSVFRRTGTGPNTFQWQYDVGSGFTDIGSSFSYTGATTPDAQAPINLSGIAALQNIAGGTSVAFRLLGAGATNAGGGFALGGLSGNDLALSGSLSAIPEPGSLTLCLAAVVSAGGAAWRKRRRAAAA